jgi:hypothetical protein
MPAADRHCLTVTTMTRTARAAAGAQRLAAVAAAALAACLTTLALHPTAARAQAPSQAAPADAMAAALQGAERIGQGGRFVAYRKAGSSLVLLPPGALGKPLLWYTEAVTLPAGMVANKGHRDQQHPGALRARGQRRARA